MWTDVTVGWLIFLTVNWCWWWTDVERWLMLLTDDGMTDDGWLMLLTDDWCCWRLTDVTDGWLMLLAVDWLLMVDWYCWRLTGVDYCWLMLLTVDWCYWRLTYVADGWLILTIVDRVTAADRWRWKMKTASPVRLALWASERAAAIKSTRRSTYAFQVRISGPESREIRDRSRERCESHVVMAASLAIMNTILQIGITYITISFWRASKWDFKKHE